MQVHRGGEQRLETPQQDTRLSMARAGVAGCGEPTGLR